MKEIDWYGILGMIIEDLAAVADDPEAAQTTMRVNLKTDTAYACGEKKVSRQGRIRNISDPHTLLRGLSKLARFARAYMADFVSDMKEE